MASAWFQHRAIQVTLALIPVVVPSLWIYAVSRNVASNSTTTTGRRSTRRSMPSKLPASLPAEVEDESQWELAFERIVSRPVPATSIAFPITGVAEYSQDDGQQSPSPLLTAYSGAAQCAFNATPQALIMRALIADREIKRSFDSTYIKSLRFEKGDLVNGGYRVAHHGKGGSAESERVELSIEAPPTFKGPVPQGLIISEIQTVSNDEGQVCAVFVNETWMWRKLKDPPTLIETTLGSWFHHLTVGWIVLKGIESVKCH